MQGTPVMISGGQRIVHLPNQQPQVVVVNNVKNNVLLQQYNGERAKVLGIAQIVCAVVIMAFNIGVAIVKYNTLWMISTGFWGTPFIITAGCLGIASSRFKLRSMIIATMAFSIIAALMFIPLVTQIALSLTTGGFSYYIKDVHIAMNVMMLLAGIAELPIAIYQAILCCNVTCNCCMEIRAIEAQNRAANSAGRTLEQFAYYNNNIVTNQQQFPQDTTPQQQFMLQPMPPPQYTMQSEPQQHMQRQYIPQTSPSPNPATTSFSPLASGASAGASARSPRADSLPPAYEDLEHEYSLEMDAKVNEWAARELRLGNSQDMDYTGLHQ